MKNTGCAVPGTALKNTGFHYTLSIIGGKYKMNIIYLLAEHKVLRHNELHRYIENISFKTLSVMLKELLGDNIISRKEYPQVPPKVEYSLTERGQSLIPILNMMCDWGERSREHLG
ncbi:helix-turn-helix domain-containing protein [Clostridium sp. HBUAS56010]|uniref:winged helix-turn-helix transcriptional regulator n=1 Tax=Clostridium sp. HBUAS56010 TaxID=2571127 RepID=UPI0011778E0E|nr:helix-turn-helix domain-containing protein [Clostridium sp. HBUAS56010]